MLMARGMMADHAVGGVDRLVDRGSRQPADREPEGGRDDAIGEVLGEALNRGARNARLVERGDVAADDVRHGRAAGFEDPALERSGDASDMVVQAPLGDQTARDYRNGEEAEREDQKHALRE